MCGITGIYAFNQVGRLNMINLAKATEVIESRGPDNQGIFNDEFVGLGHRRLSVIDTSASANQPITNKFGRYTIVYNGEIYNYKQLRKELIDEGFEFRSESDTEVLLNLYIRDKDLCVNKINGFFAFAVYDQNEKNLFIARDRYGIKPLYYYIDRDKLLFASELKSILAYGIEKEIDFTSLYTYIQLNYLPAPNSMLKDVKRLLPGHYLTIKNGEKRIQKYYQLENSVKHFKGSFDQAVDKFSRVLEESVLSRLVSDVPLGTFLSGGLDSTVVSAIAARHVDKLQTFSIGYRDEPFFDETSYANKAAKMFNTDHTIFKLTNDDLYEHVFSMLDYLDEPFADSSALAVYILSRETRKHVKVALSGDGADELFGGYNKHAALLKMMNGGRQVNTVRKLAGLWHMLPKSRGNAIFNKIRQLDRFAYTSGLEPRARYWALASLASEGYANDILSPSIEQVDFDRYWTLQAAPTTGLNVDRSITDNLWADLNMVLPNDMLTKVDLMSMAHGLEIRVPFLDRRVVEFAFGLPDEMKITPKIRKRIVQEAFRSWIPDEIYNRPKKGFEIPLLKWFKSEMKPLIMNDLLDDEFIKEQNIFNAEATSKLKSRLFSINPGDAHAHVWALIVFQWWWKRYFN